MAEVLGAFLIFTLVPILGALPLAEWLVRGLTGKRLSQVGTGNGSVSAAFYHGGTLVGLSVVALEAFRGVFAVLLARHFFGADPIWPVLSLIFLVMGRYWGNRGAGTTNVVWGFFVYDPVVAGLTLLISGVGFTLLRMRRQGRLFVLVLMTVLTALRHPNDGMRVVVVACLAGTLAWVYSKIPDDLDLTDDPESNLSRRMFQFFQGDRALASLSKPLSAEKVGAKAATLSQLKDWGYPVPPGYVLAAGDDPAALIETVFPHASLSPKDRPNLEMAVVARSSAVGEDSLGASAAGQYVSVTDIRSPAALERAITVCLNAYNAPSAIRYRQDKGIAEGQMNVLVQPYIRGVYSGVAFSRDPVTHGGDGVVIEALAGAAEGVVSGQQTPERYWVRVEEQGSRGAGGQGSQGSQGDGELVRDVDRQSDEGRGLAPLNPSDDPGEWEIPAGVRFETSGEGAVPERLIQQVAYLARQIEGRFHGIPQDVEWTFDGEQLWVLQSRPISTLQPIWTRKIAAEVIPGTIRPLTWSINRPLTCGVWGELFTLVLRQQADGLDFEQTATLHYGRAYFNATLLGEIFRRMGLPENSLEFLTRGAKFQRPPLMTTVKMLPGLVRLWREEQALPKSFAAKRRQSFDQALARWQQEALDGLSDGAIAARIEDILSLLREATWFNILAPLSLALRQAVLKVDLAELDSSQNPELAAMAELKSIAQQVRSRLPELTLTTEQGRSVSPPNNSASLFAMLADHPEGGWVLDQMDQFLETYGYLSEVATDIAVPTWRESSQPVRELLTQFVLQPEASMDDDASDNSSQANQTADSKDSDTPVAARSAKWKKRHVQARLDLKGEVAEVYDRMLAHLRACFVELESRWLTLGQLDDQGDIFFLGWPDIQAYIAAHAQRSGDDLSAMAVPGSNATAEISADNRPDMVFDLRLKTQLAKVRWQQQKEHRVPYLVYGQPPVAPPALSRLPMTAGQMTGIGASAGQVEGTVRVIEALGDAADLDGAPINRDTILVVPYTDAGWSPLLARIGGLIAEVGGQLSHGAIIAREYGIPAIMDVADATHRLSTGQRVRIDGRYGTIDVLQ